jgi:tricorn protease
MLRHPASSRIAAFSAAMLALVLLPGRPQAPQPIRFARTPHVANDGRIAFAYHDDIWVADSNGANPRRLTASVGREAWPRFSPDGRSIAFVSDRTGNDDVFVIPAAGGEPRQLTWFSGPDQVLYWTPDGTGIVIASNRGALSWGAPLFRLPLDGGPPEPLGMGTARAGMVSQDGRMIAFNRILPSTWRKGYRGNNSGDIAVYHVAARTAVELTDTSLMSARTNVNDVYPMWGADGMIYFASERDGTFNLWRVGAQGGAPQQVTQHTTGGVFFPAISPDGRRIVYQNDFALWTVDLPSGRPRKLDITLAFDPKEHDVEVVQADNRAEGFSVSPGGDYLAVDFRGEITVVPTESGVGEKTRVTASPWRERMQTYSPDGKKLAYVSDESGEDEVWLFDLPAGTRKKLTEHPSVKGDLTWAPNSQKLAFTAANRIFEVDAAGGSPRELAHNPAGGYSLSEYAPDGNWLVYMRRDAEQNAEVYLLDVRNRVEHNMTRSPFTETGGGLTPDGKTLVFLSNRDGAVNHLFAVSLARRTEDPNDPLVRERLRPARGQGARGGRGAAGGERDSAGAGADRGPAAALQVDTAGVEQRAVQLTRGAYGSGGYFLSRDGRTVYFAVGAGGFGGGGFGQGGGAVPAAERGLFQVGIDGRDRRRVAEGTFAGMQPTADRQTIFFRAAARPADGDDEGPGGPPARGFQIQKLAVAGGTPRPENVRFSFAVRVDRQAEWKQIFEESWRVMKYRFYDEKMHGYDWAAIKARYQPLLADVGSNDDVYALANAMIGEINASHTGVSGPPTRPMPDVYTTRYLGFELEPANGRYRISHIYRDGPADQEWITLAVGEYVLAIAGQEIRAGDNYWKILSTLENEYVPVRVSRTPDGANARTIRIASVTSLNNVKYEEWVANNRDVVERATGGEIAYVHIRAMNQPSLARFRNEIDRFWQAKGIIVDIRFNGGGNIDQELLDILERRPYEFWNNRSGVRTWGRRPRQAIAGPKVMMVNHRSGSDAEVTPMGFRDLGLGRIVGNPTAAAVIATGSYALINGGSIRTPGSLVVTWDPTKPDNFGINLENYGVPPDVWVKNTVMDEIQGEDRELQAAIAEVMRMLRDTRPRAADREPEEGRR